MFDRHRSGFALRCACLAGGALLMLAVHATAQQTAAVPWTEFTVQSDAIGTRLIRVATPGEYARGADRYAVLVILDAEDRPMLRLAIAQAAYLSANGDGVPALIVVGIVNGPDRIHDMTPTPTGSSVAAFKTAGGGSAFADFVLRDVLPAVRARYRTLPTTILAGHSAGGLFALHVAATHPGHFDGVVAMDPAIWFNDGAPARLYADAIARSPTGTRVFAGYGGLESDIDAATTEFSRRLEEAKPSTVAFASRRYPGDSHALVPLAALPDGLRFVFAPIALQRLPIATLAEGIDASAAMAALATSEAHYADAARSLHLPEALPEIALERTARFARNTLKNDDLAVRILERNVALHPGSARAAARLADGYTATGDLAAAIAQLRRALALDGSSATELPADAPAKLRELEQRVLRK